MSNEKNCSSVNKLKTIKKEEKEKFQEVIPIPHKPLKDEKINNSKSLCDFSFKEQIGEGTFGYVRLAINNQTGEKVAIKILEKKKILEYEDRIRIVREIKILKSLRHPNIVHLYSVLQTDNNILIIMEYAKGIELFDYIAKKKKIDEITACNIYQQIISGLDYLHKNNIVHRDIKPENLIINRKTKELKIVDFGLSNIFDTDKKKLLSSSCGSPSYAAPEMLQGKKYKPNPVDIWSSGIVLFAMICGYLPFEDDNNDLLYRKICIGKFTIPDHVSSNCKDLLKKILVTDPNKRITIKQIKNHPWFKLYNIKGKVILYEGLFIDKYIIPLDEEIIERMSKQMNLDYDNIKLYILNNKHNDITTLYYLFLLKKINSNKKSVADLKSNLFREYIRNKNNIINNENYNSKNLLNKSNKEITKDIYNKTKYKFFNHSEENKRLNSHTKRPVSYGEFNYNNLNMSSFKTRKINNLNNSNNYLHQISENGNNIRQIIKPKNFNIENKNDFNEEEEYKKKYDKKKISKKEMNTINKEIKKKARINNKDNNEKLEKILSSLKKEIKNKYLGKNDIKEENQKVNTKISNYETIIIKKKSKHSYLNHLLSNRKKIFNTIEWDGNYQEIAEEANNNKKFSKYNNGSSKYGNRLGILKNNNEKIITEKKNRNNISFKLKKFTNNNINTDYSIFNNTLSVSNEKYKKKSKNNISIIKARNETYSNSVIKTKYNHKYSVNRYSNKYMDISNSKSPVRINKSSLDIISPDYDQFLTQNNNSTYNYKEAKTQYNYKEYLTSSTQNKEHKFINGNYRKNEISSRQKLRQKIKRDNHKLTCNLNDYKSNLEIIYKNSYEKLNLHLHSSFNEGDHLYNNNTYSNKNKYETNSEEIKVTNENNANKNNYNYFEPFPLCNVYLKSKHLLKTQIDNALEELKIKYKNNGFSYVINSDKMNKCVMKINIKSLYNPSINIIHFSKNGVSKYSSIINKIQSKINNI